MSNYQNLAIYLSSEALFLIRNCDTAPTQGAHAQNVSIANASQTNVCDTALNARNQAPGSPAISIAKISE